MKQTIAYALAAASILGGMVFGLLLTPATAREPKILEFDTMVGIPPAFTGTQQPIRGINGGGLPWVVGASRGELTASGHLEVNVRGLVFSAGPNTGANTVPAFRAVVSCLLADGSVMNLSTDPFPATTGLAAAGGGNAKIEAQLDLPQPCIAPLVFVTSPTGAWFAATGN